MKGRTYMKIKRILVEEKEFVMGEIECFLCKQGISYVKVENEIHIPNLILRFFDFEEYESLYFLGLEGMIESLSLNNIPFVEVRREPSLVNPEMFRHLESIESSREMVIQALGISGKEKPSPYPPVRNNKKQQLQIENEKTMKKIKS